jgi:spermidine synthase
MADLKKIILIAFVLSGMAALIYEVVWTRPLQFVLGSTIYTVSIIFAAFMAGLALGSWLISKYVDRIKNLPSAYALLELGIGLYGILLLIIFNLLPDAYRAIYHLRESFYLFEFIQFLLSFGVILIPTTLMGATFPVIAKFYAEEKVGKGIGEIYSANNLGAITGSFSAGFLLIPILGIKSTIIFAGLINLFVAALILFISSKSFAIKVIPISFIIFLTIAYFGDYNIKQLYGGGFYRAEFPKEEIEASKILFYKEGLHATINVVETRDKTLGLLINGKGQGSTALTDLRANFLLAYLPILINPESKNALVIGLGTGTTSGQLAQFVNTTTIEIEPAIVEASKYFWFINLNVTTNPNHKLIIADGRNYLLQTKEKYDIIVSEPSDPWQSFSTALYSKEYFELAKNHLNENGLYMQWVPIFALTPNEFKIFYNTFTSIFPNVVAFANVKSEESIPTTEIILVGSTHPVNYENIEKNFKSLPLSARKNLYEGEIVSGKHILSLLLFTNEQLQGYGKDTYLVTDDHPILEFSTARRIFSANPEEVILDINRFLNMSGERQ